MPFFQSDLEQRRERESSLPPSLISRDNNRTLTRKLSEESIRTELCEGPLPDSPKPQTPEHNAATTCSDRVELIERLKKGESPNWIRAAFDSFWTQRPVTLTRSPKPVSNSFPLLSPPTITPAHRDAQSDDESRLREGLNIERPRSALHSGDFTQEELSRESGTDDGDIKGSRKHNELRASGHSWLATSPPRDFASFHFAKRQPSLGRPPDTRSGPSSLSSSLSTSFIYQPPTSPLVQSESNDDIGLTSPMEGIDLRSSIPRNPRRHTLMPSSADSYGFSSLSTRLRQPPSLRQERTFPYQAHQPRRSLGAASNFSLTGSSPQTTAVLRSRRQSYSSDTSLQHASMVGSYEESILRGRMSTTPSKPLDFLAQIGVLGLGKCTSSLRCPAHVSLPFPAVFYSYARSSHGRSKDDDGPSPYVGQIDLENGLSDQEEARSKRKIQSRAFERRMTEDEMVNSSERTTESSERDARKLQKPKKMSSSPRAPPGGSYRIPEKGQIQIIIKNPNKTAVKLFLVPYDLAGMEPGTKTFIRQRSYSAGPIIDNVPESKDGTAERPILRYLVHLHICCPSRGRFYLYKSIRVVFANRVPDGKEKLRNEITLPEPRFTNYKPIRVIHPPISTGTGPAANLAAEKAWRRRSSGFYFSPAQALDATDGFVSESALPQQDFSFNFTGNSDPVDPITLGLPRREFHNENEQPNSVGADQRQIHPRVSSQTSHSTTQESSNTSNWGTFDGQFDMYDKLNKGDVGYGGNPFSGVINGSLPAAEGLLSQRLRSLDVQRQSQQNSNAYEK